MAKLLMSGNEAIARGAWEAGVSFATGYPGTPSTEVLENLSTYEGVTAQWATNEKAAFEEGMGAALGGVRTLVTMKHVGLNVAADPFMVFPYAGTNAGFVVLVADDPGMYSSQNEQDSRYLAKVAKVPVLEPSDAAEAREMMGFAFELSERLSTPVLFRTTTRLAHTRSVVDVEARVEHERKPFEKNPRRFAIPVYAAFRRPELEAKLGQLRDFAETYEGNFIEEGDPKVGIVTHGTPYQYVKEMAPDATVLRLGMVHPLPGKMLKEFCSRFETVFVVEESEGFIQEGMASLGILNMVGKESFTNIGELSADLVGKGLGGAQVPEGFGGEVALLPRPPRVCAGCPHSGTFSALRKLRVLVTGDIGCYTLGCIPPLSAVDTTFCMGASIGNATGFMRAGEERVVAVIGDSTFLHGGLPGLLSAVYNQVPITVLILDNGTTGMTGHQDHPGTGRTLQKEPAPAVDIEGLVRAMGVEHVAVVDPWELKNMRTAVKEALAHPGPAVVIARRACVLLPEERAQDRVPFRVIEETCIQCDYCMESGCPALVMAGDYPAIREWECVGCAICAQLCPVDAIVAVEDEAGVPAGRA
ncbi:MAG: indolepyruvate ferredoxin oxidoreductase subunit alpha [Gemmatimonadetes bacterium]|nr:indolepyruvate ferredoxin oxidoreductase subunit alpha [Gemmatimonadota bacterium]